MGRITHIECFEGFHVVDLLAEAERGIGDLVHAPITDLSHIGHVARYYVTVQTRHGQHVAQIAAIVIHIGKSLRK